MRQRVAPVVERDGITFALLDYTYGVNWPDDMELPEHSINFIDKDRIAADVARAKQQADVVLVAMHWGTELLMEADDEQKQLAQFLADQDVDVVLGSHPHVIGPVEWVSNSNGKGHKTLVAYSLGNFLSDHEVRSPQVELEGMLCCDFVRGGGGDASGDGSDGDSDGDSGDGSASSSGSGSGSSAASDGSAIRIENVVWVPLVNHTNDTGGDRTDFAVYALKDYTNALAKQNSAYADADVRDPIAWLRNTTKEVVGDVIPIDDGTYVEGKDATEVILMALADGARVAEAAKA